ncbi:MAG: cell division protein FtsZ, partial [Spirochaetales bacterium]|nr:cell division protein FtsZ [Spirochaetales bacterium]
EGRKKLQFANEGIDRLRKNVDTLILIPNQYLLKVAENNTPIKQAFLMADDVLRQGVQGISELITEPGEINIDFADVRTVMKGKGDAIMGIGLGEGANRAVDAARQAISNPLLENAKIDGAKSVLVNLTASDGLTLQEYQDVVEMITENCDKDALIIAGQAYNPDLGDKVKVTVVATGFERESVTVDMPQFEKKQPRFDQFVNNADNRAAGQAPAASQAQPKQDPQRKPDEVISINRWQDLQTQLGRRQAPNANSTDYSIPSVLRYQRNDENK